MSIEAVREVVRTTRSDMYIRELFDPIQTHAVYCVPTDTVDNLKVHLKAAGATRFRTVKTGMKGINILCFKVK